MAEQVNYTQYYRPLEVGKNTIDWASLQNPWITRGIGTRIQALATYFKGSFVDPLVEGNRNFTGTFTKEQIKDIDYLKKYIKNSSILSLSQLQATGIADSWEDFDNASDEEVYAILGAYGRGNTDPNSTQKHYVSKFRATSSTNTYLSNLDTLTKNLESYGATPAEIQTYLENKTWTDTSAVTNTINNLADTWDQADNDTEQFKALLSKAQKDSVNSDAGELGNILITQKPSNDDNTGGDTTGGDTTGGDTTGGDTTGGGGTNIGITPGDEATVSVATADDAAQTASTATQSAILGDSTLDALREYADGEDNIKYQEEVQADGSKKYYLLTTDKAGNTTKQEFAVDEKNNQIVYVGGEKNGQRFSTGGLPERIDTYQDVEDTAFKDQQALADEVTGLRGEYADYTTSVLGGDVTEGVAKQLGWTKTATGWKDPQGKDYTVNKNTGILESGGVGATTKGTFEDADFAGQINAQLNQFLNGYIGTDGKPVKGFLDYQSDLEGAGQTLKTDMQGLQGMYDQAYASYEGELDPLRDQMGTITDMSMEVARDANDQNYYTRLKDTLYADAQESINRSASGARDTLNQTYANAGLDPSSPAFTAAMQDLAQSRADSERSANRQAILDSYGLGSQMLTNRSSALTGASNAIGAEMGALDSLYGVKLQGLNNRKDMIGQIYNVDKNNATVGIQGLNTVLDTGLKGIAADQNQFNTKLNLNNDFYGNLFKNIGLEYDVKGGLRNYADKETTSAFDTLVDYDQSFKSDDFTMGSFQLALQQAYPDGDIPEPLQKLIDKYSSK